MAQFNLTFLTPAQMTAFFNTEATKCPFCNSEDLEVSSERDESKLQLHIYHICMGCKKEWIEEFSLSRSYINE